MLLNQLFGRLSERATSKEISNGFSGFVFFFFEALGLFLGVRKIGNENVLWGIRSAAFVLLEVPQVAIWALFEFIIIVIDLVGAFSFAGFPNSP